MKGSYTNKVDIFSAGITIMMLLTSKHPFMYKKDDMKDTMRRNKIGRIVFHEEIWCDKNPMAIDLVKRMTCLDTDIRPSAKEALEHPWFQEFKDLSGPCFEEFEQDSGKTSCEDIIEVYEMDYATGQQDRS